MAGQASKAIVKLSAAHLQRLIDLCGEDISMSVNSCTLPPPPQQRIPLSKYYVLVLLLCC